MGNEGPKDRQPGEGFQVGPDEDELPAGPGVRLRDFPTPPVEDSLRPEILGTEEKSMSISLPDFVLATLKAECEERGDTLRTVVLRWFMRGGMPIDPGFLVDLRLRTIRAKTVAYQRFLKEGE